MNNKKLIFIVGLFVIAGLILVSRKRFPRPAAPAKFSRTHRRWGWAGIWLMAITGVTGLQLYILGFAM